MKVFNCYSVFHLYQTLFFIDPDVKNIVILNFEFDYHKTHKYKNIFFIDLKDKKVNSTFYKIFNYSLFTSFKLFYFIFRNNKCIEYYSSPHHSSILASYFRARASECTLFNEAYFSSLIKINTKINPLYNNNIIAKYLLFNYFNKSVTKYIHIKQFNCDEIISNKNKLLNPREYRQNIKKFYKIFFDFNFLSIKKNSLLILLSSDFFYNLISKIDHEKLVNKIIKKNINKFNFIYIKPHPFDQSKYQFIHSNKNVINLPNYLPYELFQIFEVKFNKVISLSNSINEI